MKLATVLSTVFCMVFSGCSSQRLNVIGCFGAATSTCISDEVNAVEDELKAYIKEENSKPRNGRYDPRDIHFVSCFRVPVQRRFPRGASIARGVAIHHGIPEVARCDLGATVFMIPDTKPFTRRDGIPSKGGWEEAYSIYDIGRERDVLLVIVGHTSGIGGSIEITTWDTQSNNIRVLWGCGGEEDGVDFSYSLRLCDGSLHLTVFGIFSQKHRAYEGDRVRLAEQLGFPVEFVYDTRYEDTQQETEGGTVNRAP